MTHFYDRVMLAKRIFAYLDLDRGFSDDDVGSLDAPYHIPLGSTRSYSGMAGYFHASRCGYRDGE
jgi:hypothetical protein